MKKKLLALMLILAMAVCFCACGESEEEIEITTTAGDQAVQDDEDISVYEDIYKEYNAKMKMAAKKSVKDLEAKAEDLSKDDLYAKAKEEVDALGKIREEGNQKMTDAMLASTDDDQETYEKWYSKLTEAFTDYSKKITDVYTERF